MVTDKTRQLSIRLHGTVKAHLQCTSGTLVLVSGLRSDTFSADVMKISSHSLSTGRLSPCNLQGSLKQHTNTTQCHHVQQQYTYIHEIQVRIKILLSSHVFMSWS